MTGTSAQSAPAATTLTDLYAAPAGGMQVDCISACETNGVVTTIRVSVAPAAAANNIKQYLAYNAQIDAYDRWDFKGPFRLNVGDVVRVYSTSGNVSFSIFGSRL